MSEDNKNIPDDLMPVMPEDLQAATEPEPGAFQKILAGVQGPVKTYSDYMKNLMNTGSLGLEPKAEAGMKALLAKIKGEPEAAPEIQDNPTLGKVTIPAEPASLSSLYDKYKTLGDQNLAQSQQNSPIASKAGQIAGIVPAAATIGATGVPGAIAGDVTGALGGGALAGIAGGATEGAAVGGGINAVQGEDIGQGIKTGALLGGGLSALGQAGSAIVQKTADIAEPYIENIPYLRQLVKANKEGISISGNQDIAATLRNNQNKLAQNLAQNANNSRLLLGQNIDKVINDYGESGSSIDLNPDFINKAKDFLDNNRSTLQNDYNKLMSKVLSFEDQEQIDPRALNQFKKELQQSSNILDTKNIKQARTSIVNEIDQKLDDIPGFRTANAEFNQFNAALPEPIINHGTNQGDYWSDLPDAQGKMADKLNDMFDGIGFHNTNGADYLSTLKNIQTNLASFEQKFPGKLEELGIDPDQYIKLIKDQGDVSAISQRQMSEANVSGGLSNKIANATMNTAGKLPPILKTSGNLVNGLKTATPEQTNYVAQKLQLDPAVKHIGDQLAKGATNPFLRNVAILNILQTPRAKAILGYDPKDENK